MHRESMIPEVPEELQRTEGINLTTLYATQQYAVSVHSKSKSKIGLFATGHNVASSFKYADVNSAKEETLYSVRLNPART